MATVRLEKVRKSFDGVEVIKGVSLDIEDRQFAVFVGPSGCGKTTLLRLIAGLEEITSGDLFIDGKKANGVPPAKRGLAMVFQSYALYPHMTVAGNLAFGLKLAGMSRKPRTLKVLEAARILHLEELLGRKPRELSGGQRQRVAIGRAIVREPRAFLFDEPLSNLDAALRAQMRVEILRLHRQLNATTIYVTHDQVEAMTMADRIIVLNEGRVEQTGTPLELYHRPRNLFVAGFIGSPRMNFIQGSVSAATERGLSVSVAGGATIRVTKRGGLRAREEVTVGFRPEQLSLGAPGGISGEALVVERLGASTFVHVRIDGGDMLNVAAEGDSPVRAGERVEIGFDPSRCHLFNQAGDAVPSDAVSSSEIR
jgi:multiple sugar transport system ATP-binding protein